MWETVCIYIYIVVMVVKDKLSFQGKLALAGSR
jgi:hypothetical protein